MKQTDCEVQCVGNQVEYHNLQYLKVPDSAHIWIPSWQHKKTKLLFPVNAAKVASKKLKLMDLDNGIW